MTLPTLLSIYHHLPYPLRVITASLKGYQLRWWRYGSETEKLIQKALARDYWSQKSWSEWQNERLGYILDKAATEVPYYRDQWRERRKKGDTASWELLENWPILKKEEVRKDPKKFLCDSSKRKRMYLEHTSGSTGTPLSLWQSKKTLHNAYAIYEARVRWWHGVSLEDRWGILGGQMVVKPNATTPPFWVWNQAFNQLYLSSYHISKTNVEAYYDAIQRHQLKYILAYPSALASLAQMIKEKNLPSYKLELAISNAEPLFDYQKEIISQVFNCEVVNTYGVSELSVGGAECEFGNIHLWPEYGFVEIMDVNEDKVLPVGDMGRIVATGLINEDMPLIRYEVGDLGSLSSQQCECSRSLPILEEIEGRMDDVLVSIDGRRVGRMDPIFKAEIPIKEAQIIQEKNDLVRLRFVPEDDFDHDDVLICLIQEKLGPMQVILEKVDRIPRGANGKFKAVIRNDNVKISD
ncbi:MAG TPA: hypothetical protein DCK95_05610 [Anaerolineaceae bacterium]|nr:hypothetical protein [Anaerolineaceae bacterium]